MAAGNYIGKFKRILSAKSHGTDEEALKESTRRRQDELFHYISQLLCMRDSLQLETEAKKQNLKRTQSKKKQKSQQKRREQAGKNEINKKSSKQASEAEEKPASPSKASAADVSNEDFIKIERELMLSDAIQSKPQDIEKEFPEPSLREASVESSSSQGDLATFVRTFLTESLFEKLKSGGSRDVQLSFPKGIETPLSYSFGAGDLIIDSVSEIVSQTDLSAKHYSEFIEEIVGVLHHSDQDLYHIFAGIQADFSHRMEMSEICLSDSIADSILSSEVEASM